MRGDEGALAADAVPKRVKAEPQVRTAEPDLPDRSSDPDREDDRGRYRGRDQGTCHVQRT
jgi:hypothetical protein